MMKYNNADVRRRDRLLNEERALELLRESEYCVLSMIDEEGKPYGFPINHIWDGGDCTYVHCALRERSSVLYVLVILRFPSVLSGA